MRPIERRTEKMLLPLLPHNLVPFKGISKRENTLFTEAIPLNVLCDIRLCGLFSISRIKKKRKSNLGNNKFSSFSNIIIDHLASISEINDNAHIIMWSKISCIFRQGWIYNFEIVKYISPAHFSFCTHKKSLLFRFWSNTHFYWSYLYIILIFLS